PTMTRSWVGLNTLACFPCMVAPWSPQSPNSYENSYYGQECYQSWFVSRQIGCPTRPTTGLPHKGKLAYESVLRTGCLGGRGRLGAAAPVASAASRAVARNVLGGRLWQRRPRVGWRAAGVPAVVGLVRLDAAEALPPVSAVMTRHALIGFRGLMVQALSEKHNSFLRPLKKKGFQEERVTTIGLYDIGKSHDPGIQQEPP